jgi:hypothetical protein
MLSYVHYIPLHLIILVMSGDEYRVWSPQFALSSASYCLPHLGPNIHPSTLFSNTHSLCLPFISESLVVLLFKTAKIKICRILCTCVRARALVRERERERCWCLIFLTVVRFLIRK